MTFQKLKVWVKDWYTVLLKMFQHKRQMNSWRSNQAFNQEFEYEGRKIRVSTCFPIRNYKTFIRKEDDESYCKCGREFKQKGVNFSLNMSGRVVCLPVQFCEICDSIPPESSGLILTIDNQFVFI